jgi:hypothetical protein
MKYTIPLLVAALFVLSVAQSQPEGGPSVPSMAIPKNTAGLVIQTPQQGVTVQPIMAVIPGEIRATVKLYFDERIQPWYSLGVGKGVIFLVNANSEDEARAIMETPASSKITSTSHRTVDAAQGIDGLGTAAMTPHEFAIFMKGTL